MKRVGIVTYHNADNLGAVLQSYALQTVLEQSCGVSAEIVDYRCSAIEATKQVKCGKSLAHCLKAFPKAVYYSIKHRGFEKFRRQYLKRSLTEYTAQTVSGCISNYDAFITGSDQVWNPECSDWDDSYFLDFVPEVKKKYAYAASLGKYKFQPAEQPHFFGLLKRFDSISVREGSAVTELRNLGIENVKVCPDPVLLLPAEHWQKIMPKRLCRQKYVLVYLVLPDKNVASSAEKYAKEHNCKVINNKKSIGFILHNSPAEFLSWIYYAECVFTNSFHGTALSLIFNKPLAADMETVQGGRNNRVQEMLEAAGALNCTLREDAPEVYAADAHGALERMRQDGMSYLHTICEEI